MNRRINANTKFVQNARVEERQQKISRASETSDRRRKARLNRRLFWDGEIEVGVFPLFSGASLIG
jgi:hypothetical protein